MTFRIRYRQRGHTDEMEALIDANGPSAALVKFLCITGSEGAGAPQREDITSVCPVETCGSLH